MERERKRTWTHEEDGSCMWDYIFLTMKVIQYRFNQPGKKTQETS